MPTTKADGGAADGDFGLSGLHPGAFSFAPSPLLQASNDGAIGGNGLSAVCVTSRPGSSGTGFDGVKLAVSPADSNPLGLGIFPTPEIASGASTLGRCGSDTSRSRRVFNDAGWTGQRSQRWAGNIGVKGEVARANSKDKDSARKRPRGSWG